MTSGAGASVTFDAGALGSDTDITLSTYDAVQLPPPPPGDRGVGQGVAIEPTGVTFDPPAALTLTYSDASLSGAPAGDLAVWIFEDGAWTRLGGTVDAESHTVTVSVSHFGLFSLMLPALSPPPQSAIEQPAPDGAAIEGLPSTGSGGAHPRGESMLIFEVVVIAIACSVLAAGVGRRRS